MRLSSIDEVYINFSGKKANWSTENLNVFIEELEDMGVLVHINIPTLEQFVEESKFNHMRCDIVAGYPMVGVSAAVQNSKMLGLEAIYRHYRRHCGADPLCSHYFAGGRSPAVGKPGWPVL